MARASLVVRDRATTDLHRESAEELPRARRIRAPTNLTAETLRTQRKPGANDSVLYGLKLSENLEQR
jgi:hypothetical protein